MFMSCTAGTAPSTSASGTTAASESASTSASTSQSASGDTIKIGLFSCLTGNNAAGGAFDLKGAKQAVKNINEAGGLLGGRQVELVPIDSTSDSNQSALILERELASRKLTAMVGNAASYICLTELPVIEKYKVPAITCAVNIGITSKGYKYIFRGGPTGAMMSHDSVALLTYLVEKSGKDLKNYKVGIVYENSAYGKDTAAGYAADCKTAGLNVVANETYPAGAFTDASPIVTKLKSLNVDLVMSVSYAQDAKLIINTMKSMEYAPLLMGGGSGFIWPSLLEEMGEDVNGIISASCWNFDSTNSSQVSEFANIVKEFEDTNKEFMSEQSGAMYTYIRMIGDAIEHAGTDDSEKVRDAIAALTSDNCKWFNLIQPGKGNAFDATGQMTPASSVIIQWQDSKPRTIWPREVASVKIIDLNGDAIE
jgi:branched-chain amino acid transport system substrate-binding protein